MSDQALVVLVTAPMMDEAAHLGRTLVEERLAACANLLPDIRSIYRWQGAIHEESEVLLMLKTTTPMFDQLRARILVLHSYETPEVLALTVADGAAGYLQWLAAQIGPEEAL